MKTALSMLGLAVLAAALVQTGPWAANAKDAPAAITGQVTSDAESAMEGVVVTAHKDGSIVSVSVTTDKTGHYAFPENRLEPGHYTLATRAVGYDLAAPAATDLAADDPVVVNLKLAPTKDLAAQLTNAEWMMSIPGTPDQKAFLLDCTSCHTMERIVLSTHDVNEWMQVISRMKGYGAVSQPIKPQPMLDRSRAGTPEQYRKAAEYLATINLSAVDHWDYALKTLPRPTGVSTRAIVTEYALPRKTIEPHDIILDKDGNVWYTDFGEQFISKFDPKTQKLTEYPIKTFKPDAPVGLLSLEFDKEGKLWFDTMYQGAIGSLDPKTGAIKYYPLPPEWNDNTVQLNFVGLRHDVDGKVWTKSVGTADIFRLDLAQRQMGEIPSDRRAAAGPSLRHLSGDLGLQEQSVDGGIRRRPSRQDRRQDAASDLVRAADPARAVAPHGDRQPGPHHGNRISRQQGRGVRSQDRKFTEYDLPPYTYPYRADVRQERRPVGFHNVHRPRRARRSEDRRDGAISDAVRHQYAHGGDRQPHHAGVVLGRLQPRPRAGQGRATAVT